MESQRGSLILFVKDMDTLVMACADVKEKFGALLVNVVVIASHTQAHTEKDEHEDAESVKELSNTKHFPNKVIDNFGGQHKDAEIVKEPSYIKHFPNKVIVKIPQDEPTLKKWKQKLEQDAKTMKEQSNISLVCLVLSRIGFVCHDMKRLCIDDQTLSEENAEKTIGWALTHHLMHHEDDKNVMVDNQYERNLIVHVIQPGEVGINFNDIGALEHVKEILKESVTLPLQRPDVFNKRQLIKPCKGILLFGPPGTGKTMLAKAVASESGANFINISVSTIVSKWVGDAKKYMKAVFSLASKLTPCVIFLDEADSLLKSRGDGLGDHHEAMHAMINEFMVQWDGFNSKDQERVLVLLATNRPSDLDVAILRRLDKREKILKVILATKELDPDVNLEAVAKMTKGYSGSDLKNLCMAAAHYPIRQFFEKEKKERDLALVENKPLSSLHSSSDIRCLSMGDFKQFIQDILVTPIVEDSDSMCWTLTSSGAFSLTSAWSHIRVRDQANLVYGAIWTALLTPTISVFIWRLLQRRIPTDDILQQRGVSLALRCMCCP